MTGPLNLSPVPKLQFFIPGTTNPLVGGLLFTYAAGTQTKQATYSNINGTPNTNPIVLDANGECVCFVDSTLEYDFWLSPSTDTDPPTNPYWTVGSVGYGDMINGFAPLNSPSFTGTPTAPTPTVGDNSTNIATTQFVQETVTNAFSGSPTTTTQSPGDYSNKIATTQYVGAEINRAWQMVAISNSTTWTRPNNVQYAKFRLWGAGGGGGGGIGGASPGSGGGAGGYCEGVISLGGNTSLAIVIGTGGSGGSPGNAGSNGGNSTIAALGITANGGGGGAGAGGSPGNGGSASGLAFTWNGGGGGITVNPGAGIPGGGGAAWGGGRGTGAGPGSGGDGRGGGTGGTSQNGDSGENGLCIIEWLEP
jgi:hypothetical protein